MVEDSTGQAVDLSLVTRIVRGYVAQNSIGVDQVAGLIATVHRSLRGLGKDAPAPAPLVPAVPIRRSVQRDQVVCLECGFISQMLRRHLHIAHGLEPAAYRVRWNLPADHPITAPAYSERRVDDGETDWSGSTAPPVSRQPAGHATDPKAARPAAIGHVRRRSTNPAADRLVWRVFIYMIMSFIGYTNRVKIPARRHPQKCSPRSNNTPSIASPKVF